MLILTLLLRTSNTSSETCYCWFFSLSQRVSDSHWHVGEKAARLCSRPIRVLPCRHRRDSSHPVGGTTRVRSVRVCFRYHWVDGRFRALDRVLHQTLDVRLRVPRPFGHRRIAGGLGWWQ